ncbi:hypothetical protein CL6EHI_145320 [Entamoeba histolytica]|uniref:Uncharacterized protein n=3 Tax=Entamoeba histolytica TaxID=5759 RepID=B1N3Y9_ENTH1|nr:hypothetical protein EHI_145320 [Entamoeba histolytica HM-1:IMSS]EDS89316.1 hypothetical protein EHI_145320 [Entamoeba histolytica HM-1:IMSS]EMD45115.1 Hypothetical protein EHI5A_197400 [Entamoeba histolytica KU27]GAT97052.1 hypothetical protein CL6EHI_145320 [Entamoeba histolytica]|eukprot:XP_001913905.1 hypothetical protein EHI_145320 [Entamoeba histolytica HM-1:IMSS]
MSGIAAPLALIKYLNDIKLVSDIVVDKLNDLTIQHKLMDDDPYQLNFSQAYIRSVLPPELWKRIENVAFEPNPADFERRGLHQYLYKQPHFNKIESGKENYEMMKNVHKQLKHWGTSDKRTDYEKVLLRVSPDDDKINHFKTINGKIKFYNK